LEEVVVLEAAGMLNADALAAAELLEEIGSVASTMLWETWGIRLIGVGWEMAGPVLMELVRNPTPFAFSEGEKDAASFWGGVHSLAGRLPSAFAVHRSFLFSLFRG
jgi:hypothetical protein